MKKKKKNHVIKAIVWQQDQLLLSWSQGQFSHLSQALRATGEKSGFSSLPMPPYGWWGVMADLSSSRSHCASARDQLSYMVMWGAGLTLWVLYLVRGRISSLVCCRRHSKRRHRVSFPSLTTSGQTGSALLCCLGKVQGLLSRVLLLVRDRTCSSTLMSQCSRKSYHQ